jgi:hypothetical protein
MVNLHEGRYRDQSSYIIESDVIRAEFVAAGGRMVSLRDKRIDHEFLFQQEKGNYIKGQYDLPMALDQAAGYDDMFPTIAECFVHEEPWKGTRIPDHGEVWSLGWEIKTVVDSWKFLLNGIRLPYRLTRTVTLPAVNRLRMAFTAENPTPFPMPYLWSAHAMFQPEEGGRIVLPEECTQATVIRSHSGRLGKYGDHVAWPHVIDGRGKHHDLSIVRTRETDDVEAYIFARPLTHGKCALTWPSIKRTVALTFPVGEVPFLTILVGEGLKSDPRFFVLLEPCSAPFGRLDGAEAYTSNTKLPSNGSRQWHLDFEVEEL